MALPKKNRIVSKKDIDRIFKNGRTVKGSSLFIRFLKGGQKGYPRFVFIVPTKYIPLAVDRNKVKRVLSEKAKAFLAGQEYDIVVGVSKKVSKKEVDHVVEEFKELMSKL